MRKFALAKHSQTIPTNGSIRWRIKSPRATSNCEIVCGRSRWVSSEGTITASFLVVPPSRKDAARTWAPSNLVSVIWSEWVRWFVWTSKVTVTEEHCYIGVFSHDAKRTMITRTAGNFWSNRPLNWRMPTLNSLKLQRSRKNAQIDCNKGAMENDK
jgi:hypothetical protein